MGFYMHATLLKAYFVVLFSIVIVLCGQTQPSKKGCVWLHETIYKEWLHNYLLVDWCFWEQKKTLEEKKALRFIQITYLMNFSLVYHQYQN